MQVAADARPSQSCPPARPGSRWPGSSSASCSRSAGPCSAACWPRTCWSSGCCSPAGLWTGLLGACVWASRRWGTGRLRDDYGLRARGSDVGRGLLLSLGARFGGGLLLAVLVAVAPGLGRQRQHRGSSASPRATGPRCSRWRCWPWSARRWSRRRSSAGCCCARCAAGCPARRPSRCRRSPSPWCHSDPAAGRRNVGRRARRRGRRAGARRGRRALGPARAVAVGPTPSSTSCRWSCCSRCSAPVQERWSAEGLSRRAMRRTARPYACSASAAACSLVGLLERAAASRCACARGARTGASSLRKLVLAGQPQRVLDPDAVKRPLGGAVEADDPARAACGDSTVMSDSAKTWSSMPRPGRTNQ